MSIPRSRLTPILFLMLAACSSGSEPSAPLLPTSANLNNGNGVVIQVNGAGAVDLSAAAAGEAEFQLVAHLRADGTLSGHFRQSRSGPSGTVDFAGYVTCVTTDPNFPGPGAHRRGHHGE